MLVDLGRNDLGKVCEFGSVNVKRLKYIQRFSHIMHMTSDVEGVLRQDKNRFDAFKERSSGRHTVRGAKGQGNGDN